MTSSSVYGEKYQPNTTFADNHSAYLNSLKEKLYAGEAIAGSWLCSGSAVVAELMASCGYDFLAVDAEHSAVGVAETQALFQSIRSGSQNCAALVRLPGIDCEQARRYMDAGADGVIAPLINTATQAEKLVQAVKYPPRGKRGLGFCRANSYGMDVDGSFENANAESFVAVQIEHIEAVKNIDSILEVDGVDAAFIGPFDLSASMGIAGQFDHPEMKEKVAVILAACQKHDVAPGIHVVKPDPGEFKQRVAEGFRFIAYSLDITMLSESSREGLSQIKTES